MPDLVIIGGGGHAKVVADLAKANKYNVLGFLDDDMSVKRLLEFHRLGCIDDCAKYAETADFIIAIGDNGIRKNIFQRFSYLNYAVLVHPTAVIGTDVSIGRGTVVMPGAIVNADAKIGDFCVINTAAVVEHDCKIGNFSFLAPKSTVCGFTDIGECVWLGSGSVVNNVLEICDSTTVGSGGVVVRNITRPSIYVGVPAKELAK